MKDRSHDPSCHDRTLLTQIHTHTHTHIHDGRKEAYVTIQCRSIPWKMGWGGGGAQSNFPTRDHQNIFNLILIWSYIVWGEGGGGALRLCYVSKIWDAFSVSSSYFLDVLNRNWALGKQCSQSSDYVRWGEASHAVDGNTSGTYDDRHCTHTKFGDKHPWWMVDVGGMLAIESVTIFNRVDCCSKYQMWLFLYKHFTL